MRTRCWKDKILDLSRTNSIHLMSTSIRSEVKGPCVVHEDLHSRSIPDVERRPDIVDVDRSPVANNVMTLT